MHMIYGHVCMYSRVANKPISLNSNGWIGRRLLASFPLIFCDAPLAHFMELRTLDSFFHSFSLSVAVVNPSPKRNQFLSPRDEEERRRLLKSLVAPKGMKEKSKRRASVFESMIIKAARSAENLPVVAATATAISPTFAAEASGRDNFRKESTVSLQVQYVCKSFH